jgi:hypothetical protein
LVVLKKSKSINPAFRQAGAEFAKYLRKDRKELKYIALTLNA